MSKICVTCGLPEELCVCQDIAKESQRITVMIDRRKFGKEYTVVKGIDESEINIKDLAKKLKNKLACGGTAKNKEIALQGNHAEDAVQLLIKEGFAPETIEVKK